MTNSSSIVLDVQSTVAESSTKKRMIVKVFQHDLPNVAVLTNADKSIRHNLVLDETLRNKMNRRTRAFFEAEQLPDGNVALYKRVPNQKW